MEFNGRCALVTGAGSGLGRATALAFARAGARVALLDRSLVGAEETAAEATADGCSDILVIESNIADATDVEQAMKRIDETFGTIHVCVNAAATPAAGKIVTRGEILPLESFRGVIEVNLIGAFDVMRHCARRMVSNEPDNDGERGVIINVSSGAAWQGQTGQAAYAASKAGLIGLSLPLSRDLAQYGVRVVAIAPGLFDTPGVAELPDSVRVPLERMPLYPNRPGRPAEFAGLACHIVNNRYFNATTVVLDGGIRLV